MSMHESLRAIRDKIDWLRPGEPDQDIADVPTPVDDAASLVVMAKQAGVIDRQSATWMAVSRWAAIELIEAQRATETARGDKAMLLQGAIATLRCLLALDDKVDKKPVFVDQAPHIP